MNRRGFMGLFGGAVVAGPSAVKAAADDRILRSAGFITGSDLAGAAACDPVPPTPNSLVGRVRKWIRKVGVPEWKMQELRRRANHDRSYGLDPDLACLRSVSAGYKAREQRRRNLERLVEHSIAAMDYHGQRSSFMQKISDKFGQSVDWYE